MVFSDALFLFLFLPVVLGLYWCTPRRYQNLTLLVFSLVFYAIGEGAFIAVMLASILFNYFAGLLLSRELGAKGRRVLITLAVLGNLGMLTAFKYLGFVLENISALALACGLPALPSVSLHLPIGISFFTFQAMSYVIDVYRKEVPVQRRVTDLALYVALFPQLIAGPIVRYATVAEEITSRVWSRDKVASGVERFIVGLAKKTMVANPCGRVADSVFALPQQELGTPVAWLGLLCYSLQIYFDFSAYSDMAIGLGRVFGFSFLENFNYPYAASSLTDFWRRWHISLSTWFRDYLYIPLGGNRGTPVRTYVNLLTVFLLCGLWHGASWNFLIWGLLHGAFLVLERGAFGPWLKAQAGVLRHLYVALVVMLTWVFFRCETLPESISFLKALVGGSPVSDRAQPLAFHLDPYLLLALILGAIGSTPWLARIGGLAAAPPSAWGYGRISLLGALLFGSCVLVAAGTYNPFIYFRF